MQKLMKERLRELKRRQRRRRQMGIIAAFFGVIVIGGVVWGMTRPGVAMTGDATCGMEEHKHSDKCYENVLVCEEKESEGHKHDDSCYKTEEVLVCDKEECEANPEEGIEGHTHDKGCYEEKKELTCKEEESKGHTHSDKCYKEELSCGKEEHTHEEDCYIDRSADVEKKSDWDKQYKSIKWKDAWGEDLVTAAEKQVGYKESTKNYKKISGEQKGYTRYGEFSGEPYADWDAAFVNFCIHYAGISKSDVFPNTTDTNKWYNKFSKVNGSFLTAPDGYEPEKGDIVFFEKKKGETDFAMGIVSSSNKDKKEIKVIEGNIDNEVKEEKYGTGDSQIFAYIKVTELEQAFKGMESDDAENKEEQEETEEPAETEEPEGEETEEPSPAFDSEYDGDGVIIHVKADEGVVPEGAELSVTPIEKKKITSDMSAEEKEEAEKVNAQYDMTNEKLNEESEKNEQELQGFLAYDISFMLDGKEIEPNGEVKVTMDFKEAVAPEGVSEDAQVAVNHLKENGNGGVKVENLTAADTTTIQTVEKDTAVEKVELVANEFSIFTISWGAFSGSESYEARISVEHYVGTNRIEVTPTWNDPFLQLNLSGTEKYSLETLIGWEPITVNDKSYTPLRIDLYSYNNKIAENITQIMTDTEKKFHFLDANDVELHVCGIADLSLASSQYVLHVIYEENVAGLKITNDIEGTVKDGKIDEETAGDLVVNLSGEAKKRYEEAKKDPTKNVEFVWHKSVTDGNGAVKETIVERTEYEGERWNISEDGKTLNVALDQGAKNSKQKKVEYWVELKIDGESIAESPRENITYFSQIQNGSFEQPALEGLKVGDQLFQWKQQAEVEGWNTTSSKGTIEIARVLEYSRDPDGTVYGMIDTAYTNKQAVYNFCADDGIQFAELNAETHSSLYQDVLVTKGEILNYSFAHRARPSTGNVNEMYLVILPTALAKNGINGDGNPIDTQEEVSQLINPTPEQKKKFPGLHVEKLTAYTNGWTTHTGTYIPKYDLTRFFFVSVAHDSQEGNFIDNVSFGQDIAKPKPGKFNLQIAKKINGLDDGKTDAIKEKLEFNVSITDLDGTPISVEGLSNPIRASQMTWGEGANSNNGIFNLYNIPIGEKQYKVSVEEVSGTATVNSYDLFTNVTAECISSSNKTLTNVSKDNLLKKDDKSQSSNFKGELNPVVKGNTAKFTFTNSYTVADNSSWKVVKRSYSDKSTPLEGASFTLTEVGASITESRKITGTSNARGEIDWIITGEDKNKPEESKPLDISTLNGGYILKETKAPDGYSCSEKQWTLTFNNGKLDAVALAEQIKTDEKFIVLNTKDDVHEISIYNARLYELPSTGGKGIYLYMFSGILLMAGGLLMTYKNRRRGVLRS